MLEWYSNKYVEIYFDIIPQIAIRYILPFHTPDKKKSIKKYPFINSIKRSFISFLGYIMLMYILC